MSTELANLLLVIFGALGLVISIFGGAIRRGLRQMSGRSIITIVIGVVGALLLVLGVYRIASPAGVTTTNVEQKARDWLEAVKLAPHRVEDPTAFFRLETQPTPGNPPIDVVRPKDDDRFVYAVAKLGLSDDDKIAFPKLPLSERARILLKLRAVISQAKFAYVISGSGVSDHPEEFTVAIFKKLPITKALTQLAFYDAINEVGFGSALVNDTIELELGSTQRLDKNITQPSPTPDKGVSPH